MTPPDETPPDESPFDSGSVDDALEALDRFGRPVKPVAGRYPPVDPSRERSDDDADAMPHGADATPRRTKDRPRRRGNWRHNAIALLFLVATIGVFAYYSVLWNDPWSPLNPLPPATPFVVITATPDPFAAVPPVPTVVPTAAPTQASAPLTPTLPPLIATTAPDDAGEVPDTVDFPFVLATDEILYTPNGNGRECDWASIAGTVTGLDGAPLNNYGVQITDIDNPGDLDRRVFSGSALTFGEGGFELALGGFPRQGRYRVQLFNPAGVAVSDTFQVITSDRCDQNVVVIQFRQIAPL